MRWKARQGRLLFLGDGDGHQRLVTPPQRLCHHAGVSVCISFCIHVSCLRPFVVTKKRKEMQSREPIRPARCPRASASTYVLAISIYVHFHRLEPLSEPVNSPLLARSPVLAGGPSFLLLCRHPHWPAKDATADPRRTNGRVRTANDLPTAGYEAGGHPADTLHGAPRTAHRPGTPATPDQSHL